MKAMFNTFRYLNSYTKVSNPISFNFIQMKNFSVNSTIPCISLSNIKDNHGARKKKTILGRGPGSKKGKTSGKGHKGKQHGYMPPVHIQGGQTPIQRKFPKINYIRKAPIYTEVNISKIVTLVKQGRLDANKTITIRDLGLNGAFSKVREGVKLLGKGAELINTIPPINIIVNHASQTAIDAIKSNGGTIVCEYKTKLGMKFQLKPYKFVKEIRDPVINYRRARLYMKLEKRGAEVRFIKPNWLLFKYEELKKKIENIHKKLDAQPNSHLLPEYPVDRRKGLSDNKPKIPKTIIPKKVIFDGKTNMKPVKAMS